jgi:glutamate---cysteine ligase / carboxylate-amine ligase
VELITDVVASADEAVAVLAALRHAVLDTGVGLLASGTHPTSTEEDGVISDKERYERIRYLLGDAAATPVAGLHIHVGMANAATAIRAFNGMRRDLPLLQALAANSPFRHGRDTGLASAREVSLRAWARSGVPRAMRDFEDFCQMSDRLAEAAGVADYTWFWWKLRPHPRLGTVEIRALDVQASLSDTAALVALAHCLTREAAEGEPRPDPPPEILEEAMFRAARYGVEAKLPDEAGRLRMLPDLLQEALTRAQPHARELGCEEALERLPELVRGGGGAGRQRAVYELTGIDALLRELVRVTAVR